MPAHRGPDAPLLAHAGLRALWRAVLDALQSVAGLPQALMQPALQAALNLTALNICTLVLASILKVSENNLSAHEESIFMLQCRQFAMQCASGCMRWTSASGARTLLHRDCPRLWHPAAQRLSPWTASDCTRA